MAAACHSSATIASSSSLHRTPYLPLSAPAGRLSSFNSFSSEFRALRAQLPPSKLPLIFNSARFSRPRVVCQAQETVVDFPTVTDATWQALVLKADGPVLVEFWAPWCGPCRVMHPIVAELSVQYAGKLNFFRLNTDESRFTASKYGIRSVPTILMFVNGEKKDTVLGAVSKTTLTSSIEKFL